ncbi:TPA: hypothetical protein G9F27_005368 [Salmonella enterica]|uniref:Uncharacterized protein n=1 Tax=Salmonella enterica TaxID=28901 RepID=A0A743SPY7_SALER|nr:hypothetical protein [Salmonella enterica]
MYDRTRDALFLPDPDASDIQEQINRLTWHLSDMVPRYRARSPGAGKQRLVTLPGGLPRTSGLLRSAILPFPAARRFF